MNRTNQCFKCIFQHASAGIGVVLALCLTNLQEWADSERPCVGGECLAINEAGTAVIECTFVEFRIVPVERFCDD